MYCAGSAMVAPQLVLVVGVLGLFLCNHAAGAAGRDLGLSQTQLHVRIDLSNGDPARAPMVALSTPASTTDGPRVTWELPPSIEVQRWFAVNVTDADSNVVYSTGMSSVLAGDRRRGGGGDRRRGGGRVGARGGAGRYVLSPRTTLLNFARSAWLARHHLHDGRRTYTAADSHAVCLT